MPPLTKTKIVQGYNNPPDLLNPTLLAIFTTIKQNLKDTDIRVHNIVFRQIHDKITILLHIPDFTEDMTKTILNLTNQISVTNLAVHPHKQLNESLPRKALLNSYIQTFTFPDTDISINYTATSFLQPNLLECQKMYSYIKQLLISLKCTGFSGFGEDTLNISQYVQLPSSCFVHYEDTVTLNTNKHYQGTTSFDDWLISHKTTTNNVLIVTPGRKGFTDSEVEKIKQLEFKYIIYISCKPESKNRDLLALKYKSLSCQPFDMFPDLKDYTETVELWTRPTYISIGKDCCIANLLENNRYYPFDWCKMNSIVPLLDVLNSDYRLLLDKDKYSFYKDSDNFFYIDEKLTKVYQETTILRYMHNKHYINFPHELRSVSKEDDLTKFFEKMARRVERIKDVNLYKIFVRYENKPQQVTKEMINILLKHCQELIMIVPDSVVKKMTVESTDRFTVVRDVWEAEHVGWQREGLRHVVFD